MGNEIKVLSPVIEDDKVCYVDTSGEEDKIDNLMYLLSDGEQVFAIPLNTVLQFLRIAEDTGFVGKVGVE